MEFSEIELRRGAAVHEAGHAIVAWTLGLKVPQLRIGEDGKGASCIEYSTHLPILDQIAIAAAGMEAGKLLRAPTWELAAISDYVKINELLDDYPDQREHLICQGHERAREILVDRLTILTDLSDALARSGLLDAKALLPFACV
jgi:hypothetical protein